MRNKARAKSLKRSRTCAALSVSHALSLSKATADRLLATLTHSLRLTLQVETNEEIIAGHSLLSLSCSLSKYEGTKQVAADWLLAPWCFPALFHCKHEQTARTTDHRCLALPALYSHSPSKHEGAARGHAISQKIRTNYTKKNT